MSTPLKIVLIDDDRAWLDSLADYFQEKGFHVRTAQGGMEALTLLAEERGEHLAVVDFKMPGMDGLEFLRKARPYNVAVVVVSSEEDPTLQSRAAALGAAMFLSKNLPTSVLLQKLCEVLLTSAQSNRRKSFAVSPANDRFLPVPVHLLLPC